VEATTLSHYRILGLLDRGGVGEVYQSEDTSLGPENSHLRGGWT